MSELQDVLDRVIEATENWGNRGFARDVRVLVDAAKRVANGFPLRWCMPHHMPMSGCPWDDDSCIEADALLLIDPPEAHE